MKITVRKAERKDCTEIIELKKESARDENLSHLLVLSPQDLERDGFDASPPLFHCIVAVDEEKNVVVGYGIYYLTYLAWEGPAIFLDDLYVAKTHQRQGVGTLILKQIAKDAVKENYPRITLQCKKENLTGIDFLEKNYGQNFSKVEGWTLWKIENEALRAIAQSESSH